MFVLVLVSVFVCMCIISAEGLDDELAAALWEHCLALVGDV